MFFMGIFQRIQHSVKLIFKTKYRGFESFIVFIHEPIDRIFAFIKKNKKFLFCLFVAFLISDLLLIKSYSFLLPDEDLPPLSFVQSLPVKNLSSSSYKNIWENNIFHSGPIPLQLSVDPVVSDPVLSSLPFKLKGTIIHANPRRSVATVTAGSNNKTSSYQQGDVIENQAEIKEILRAKIIFFNQNNNRLEYILIPEKKKVLKISYMEDKPKIEENRIVNRVGSNKFQVRRSDINEYLQKLPEILRQARVVPHRSEKDGKIEGFRFASVDKGSIFEDLGFEKGLIIKKVDGEMVSSPEKALELYDRLKGGSRVKILVQKDGKDIEYEYNVNEDATIR